MQEAPGCIRWMYVGEVEDRTTKTKGIRIVSIDLLPINCNQYCIDLVRYIVACTALYHNLECCCW